MWRILVAICSVALPWSIRRWLLASAFGYEIHPTSRIGFSFVLPRMLVMEEGSQIGHLNVFKGLSLVHLSPHGSIGNLNWVTGFPSGVSKHFQDQPGRRPELIIETHAAVSNRHLLDCTDRVVIGAHTTFAGFRSQILTHSIDLGEARQAAYPVTIGPYSFIGTDCVLLAGSALPGYSVLAAKSLLNKKWVNEFTLYGGVPAKPIKSLPENWQYFKRSTGFID